MAILTGGITGSIQGRIGTVIGERWKGINYIKQYRKPIDRRTEAQLEQRDKFVSCNLFMSRMPSVVLDSFIPFHTKATPPRAEFTRWNLQFFDTDDLYQNILMSKGNLEPVTYIDAVYHGGFGTLIVQWNVQPVGMQSDDDKVAVLVLTSDNMKWYVNIFEMTLSDGAAVLDVGTSKPTFLARIYLILGRGDISSLELLSNSSYNEKWFIA